MHINSILYARISPQWRSDLECLWPSVPWWVACKLDSLLGSLAMPGQHSQPFQLCWIKGVCMCRRNLPSALLAKWLGSFTCHCGNMGWNGHWMRVSTESQLWRRKFSHCSCRVSNSQSFHYESLNHESSTLPTSCPSKQTVTLTGKEDSLGMLLFQIMMMTSTDPPPQRCISCAGSGTL